MAGRFRCKYCVCDNCSALHKRSGADLSAIVSSGGFGSNAIKDIAIAPNGNIILAAVYASGRYICVTDGMFGAVPGVPTNYSTFGNAGAVAVQPNGNIVIGNDVGSLWVCTGQLTINQTATGLGNITDIAVQPNGNIVVGNAQGVVKILDGNNIANVISSDSDFGRVYKLACLSNGDVVVASAANSGQLQIRDANDLTVIKAHDYGCGVVTFLGVQPVQDVTIPGDANKDGMVNVGDLGILAANDGRNLQTDRVASELWWSLGDFNLDGQVNVGDLGILAANYGQGVNAAADFEADYAKIFGTSAEEDSADETDGSICSALGLPLVIGLLLMGLMLMKLED